MQLTHLGRHQHYEIITKMFKVTIRWAVWIWWQAWRTSSLSRHIHVQTASRAHGGPWFSLIPTSLKTGHGGNAFGLLPWRAWPAESVLNLGVHAPFCGHGRPHEYDNSVLPGRPKTIFWTGEPSPGDGKTSQHNLNTSILLQGKMGRIISARFDTIIGKNLSEVSYFSPNPYPILFTFVVKKSHRICIRTREEQYPFRIRIL